MLIKIKRDFFKRDNQLGKRVYIAFDEQAIINPDDTEVVGGVGPCKSDEEAIREYRKHWGDVTAALYSYVQTGWEISDRKFVAFISPANTVIGGKDGS